MCVCVCLHVTRTQISTNTNKCPRVRSCAFIQIRTGVGWETVNVTAEAASMHVDFEIGGISYCFVPRSVCYDLCNDPTVDYTSPTRMQCETYSCPFPLPQHAFFNTHGGPNCSVALHADAAAAAGAPRIDAIIIEGPTPEETYAPMLGRNPETVGQLLYFPIFGTWNGRAFCRSGQELSWQQPAATLPAMRECRPIEFVRQVNGDAPPLTELYNEGDCLTWDAADRTSAGLAAGNASQHASVSCRGPCPDTDDTENCPTHDLQGFQPTYRLITTCSGETLQQQPACVPEYERHRITDTRASLPVGDFLEIGSPRRGGAGGRRLSLRVTRAEDLVNTTNPYTYQTAANTLIPDKEEPVVQTPVRLTTYMSTVRCDACVESRLPVNV